MIPREILGKEFTLNFHSKDAILDVYMGNKARNMQTCFKGMFSEVLQNKGYFGVSSRNTKESVKSVDLNVVKILNKDPNAYRDDSKDLETQGEIKQQEEEKQIYTDDLGNEAVDILEQY